MGAEPESNAIGRLRSEGVGEIGEGESVSLRIRIQFEKGAQATEYGQ